MDRLKPNTVLNSFIRGDPWKDRAALELKTWSILPNYHFTDTETTGLGADDVPLSWAICDMSGSPILDIKIKPVSVSGQIIKIKTDAYRVHGISDQDAAQFSEPEIIIKQKLYALPANTVFIGYNIQFDKRMIINLVGGAALRTGDEWLMEFDKWLRKPERWLECKPTFCEAIGRSPNSSAGKKTKLEDVARAVGVLDPKEKQAHGALADCQLLASIRKRILEEHKMAAAKVTPKDIVDNAPKVEIVSHLEAKTLVYTDLAVLLNGLPYSIPVAVTTREGATIEDVYNNIIIHLSAIQMLIDNEDLPKVGIVSKDNLKVAWLKGGEEPERPAAPSNVRQLPPRSQARPAAQRPAAPARPAARPAAAPARPSGGKYPEPQEGDEGEVMLYAVRRVVDEKGEKFMCETHKKDGTPGAEFMVFKQEDRDSLCKYLISVGIDVDDPEFPEEGVATDFIAHFVYGGYVKGREKDKLRYRNNLWFESVNPDW